MKLVAQIQLRPTEHQQMVLKDTLERANAACNAISDYAWDNKLFSQYPLHRALYKTVREQFSLSAQIVVRCISKVVDAYKLDKTAKRYFKEHGSIAYDSRILKYRTDMQIVSIWTLPGREAIPYVCGERQRELLKHQKGESDLVYRRGKWYLLATCDIDEPPPAEVDRWLGVDRGISNLAADSDGEIYQGDLVEEQREWLARRRRELQQVGTKSAKKRLRQLAGKQDRFQRYVNHCISKRLVLKAKRTNQGIALEDLRGINLRTRARHEDRAKRGNWSFDQLEQFIRYKARLYGVEVIKVDPRYTSQRCAVCGHTENANRRSQSVFLCCACGHTTHADLNAAVNISLKATRKLAYDLGYAAEQSAAQRQG